MKLVLLGAGRMGTEVGREASACGHEVVATVTRSAGTGDWGDADVAIDFTRPEAVLDNIRAAVTRSVPIVVGTTGWYERLDEARGIIGRNDGALVYGPNFSIGANLFLTLVERAASWFDGFDDYDPYVLEHHHRAKLDAPSGTAARAAELILERMARKSHVLAGNPEGSISPQALQVASVRAGAAFGRHEVGFDGATDVLTVVHEARNRSGFARGALYAARWVRDKKGVHDFRSILSLE